MSAKTIKPAIKWRDLDGSINDTKCGPSVPVLVLDFSEAGKEKLVEEWKRLIVDAARKDPRMFCAEVVARAIVHSLANQAGRTRRAKK